MKAIAIIGSFVVLALLSTAQPLVVKQWDRRYGGTLLDPLTSLVKTTDGGFLLGGFSLSSLSGDKTEQNWDTTLNRTDYWVVKTNSFGNKEWDKRFGGLLQDNLSQALQTVDGGFILAGISTSDANGDKTEPSRGGSDYWMVKIDASGNKVWDRRFGGILDDRLNSIKQTRDSGFILCGYSNSPLSGDKTQPNWDNNNFYNDIWLVKTDSVGHKEWDKRFGGTRDEIGGFVEQADDGGYIVACFSKSDISGDKTESNWDYTDYWIIKIDSIGNKVWDKRFGGTSDDLVSSLLRLPGGEFLIGGYSYSNTGGDKTQNSWAGQDYWVIKIDSLGHKLWDKDYGGLGNDIYLNLTLDRDGGYLLAGESYSNSGGNKSEDNMGQIQTWILKIDSDGKKLWDKTIQINGNAGNPYLAQSSDGCYAVASTTWAEIGGYKTQANWDSSADYWIMKFCMDTATGINTPKSPKGDLIQVYPNPFTTDLSIALNTEHPTGAEFTITNPVGQIIFHSNETNLATGYTKVLDLSYLPDGLYFLEVVVDGERVVRQLVKE